MQRQKPEIVTLDDILITEELSRRPSRSPNWQAENQAMRTLAQQMAHGSGSLIQTLADLALELCQAGSAGVSLLETTAAGEEVFRAHALAGTLAQSVSGKFKGKSFNSTTPRNFSLCSVCLERRTPLLFSYPERYTDFQDANTPLSAERHSEGIVEALVVPLISDCHAFGTIWMMSHDEQCHFDLEDVRVMTGLADFTAAALLAQRQFQELLAKNVVFADEGEQYRADQKRSDATIAADLVDTQLLQDLSVQLVTESNIQALYQKIMAAAITFTQADAGSVQTFDEATQDLVLLATQNFDRTMTDHFYRVRASSNTSCGMALASGNRAFVDFDVPQSEDPDGSMRVHVEAGYLSAQSTPLIARSGNLIGMLSTHWRKHYRPNDRKLRFLDLLVRQAADLIEQRQSEAALRESEEKYRSLFNSIDEGHFLIDVIFDETDQPVDLLYVEANRAAIAMFGQDFTGRWLREINPNDEPSWYEIFGRVARTGKSERLERYSPLDQKWYDFYVVKVGDVSDRRVAVVSQDITERKQSEEQLRQAAKMDAFRVKLSDALRSLSDPIEIQRTATRVLGEQVHRGRALYAEVEDNGETYLITDNYAGSDYPKLLGRLPVSTFGEVSERLRLGETVVVEDVNADERLSQATRAVFTEANAVALVAVSLVKSDRWVCIFVVTFSTVRRWSKNDVAIVEETAERTWAAVERARAEEELRKSEVQRVREQVAREKERQRAETLAELDRAKTIFFSNVSHEFRTPLTLMLAPLQDALSDRTLPPAHREGLDLAHRSSLRLLKLVNTLLDFSRIQAGRMEAVYEPTDLAQFTTELASVFRSAIERAELRLIVDCLPLPEAVYVDREMWEKIVLNLLSNAFKFTFEGEITLSIRAEARETLQTSTAEVDSFPSEPQVPGSELETSTSELGTSTSELGTLPSELGTSTSELGTLPSELGTSTSELGTPSSELGTPPSELGTSSSELGTSSSELGTSSSELGTSSLELGVSRSEVKPSPSFPHVVLEVRDTGVGIPPDELPHLFKRFYQVRGTQARTNEGSGIGLALVNELVRLHGGTIDVSSTVGQGTCFTIALPLGKEHLPSDRLQDEGDRIQLTRTLASTAIDATLYVKAAERWLPENDEDGRVNDESETALHPSSRSGSKTSLILHPSKPRVLLVDDNADMREYLTRILSEYVHVEAVADGGVALAAARSQVPDLILSDVMMPGLDGFELLQALRADPRTKEVPIILLSARAGEEAIVEGLEAGADDYLIKPFSAQELVSRVNAHLQMAQLRGEALHQARTNIRRRDELLSTVSHELNTPLVSILGWTRLLRTSPPSPSMLTKALDTIERNATLQAKLVQDLLDISRITTGKLRLKIQPIELEAVIETAIATVHHLAEAKGIGLVWWGITDPVQMTNAVVMGDRDRLQQVICNLLSNAIKFTPTSGSVAVELLVTDDNRSPDAAYAEIRVTDTGIGIAADFLPHIFDRFRQSRDSDSENGLGLGLAIASHLVTLHNGTIHAESAGEGQGATLIVRLPLLTSMTHEQSLMT
ncbi:MAG: response regulator [Myxacorys chilensis ATA2-1-KO14]|jgi:signal transduction histidine kinase/PAS domain-containing protein|nr:response regulator [Myxacorys chilensis ATA2-1-KO14]